MKVSCFKCKKEFVPGPANTRIIGPYVEVECPFCYDKYDDKLINYVRDQLGGFKSQSPRDAAIMMKMAEFIELKSSDYYKKRGLRHGRKKVRNIRD